PFPPPGDIPGDAWVNFMVEPAAGRTAAQAADAEIADQIPGLNITRSETTMDGAPAVVVDGLSSFDSVRKVYIVMNDRLYILWFMPWFPNASAPTLLDKLYDTVMGSIHFYPPAGAQ
ncbi:MAG TPA: hypothetical protein VIV15_16400, partial [Anaerolineales bacterium]